MDDEPVPVLLITLGRMVYAVRVKVYAVALEKISVNRARPVTPDGTVRSPKLAPTATAAADKMPLVATAIVTVFAPAVLSIIKSNTVPAVAPSAAPKSVPVGSVIVVAAADVDVMYPVATCAAVAVAVALIAAAVCVICGLVIARGAVAPVKGAKLPLNPFVELTGPENVVLAMVYTLHTMIAVSVCMSSAWARCCHKRLEMPLQSTLLPRCSMGSPLTHQPCRRSSADRSRRLHNVPSPCSAWSRFQNHLPCSFPANGAS